MPSSTIPTVPLRNTRFDHPQFNALGVECMALSELMRRVPAPVMQVPERLDFYMLLLVTSGAGAHMVDFVETALAPGTVVFVRPGQVQQWRTGCAVDGILALVAPASLASTLSGARSGGSEALGVDEWPAVFALPPALHAEIDSAMQLLQHDFARFDQGASDAALIRHSLHGVLMRLARWLGLHHRSERDQDGARLVHRLFLRELETGFRQRQSVRHYAARLGYAEATLTRACKAAAGCTAKQLIDRRISLEAARELVHSQASVADIAHRLGFSEPTNFVKFFSRMQGLSPLSFRHRMRLR